MSQTTETPAADAAAESQTQQAAPAAPATTEASPAAATAPAQPDAAPAKPAVPDEGTFRSMFRSFAAWAIGAQAQPTPLDLSSQLAVAYQGEELTLAETIAKETGADSIKAVQLAIEARKERDRLTAEAATVADSAKALTTERDNLAAQVKTLTDAATAATSEITSLKEQLVAAQKAKADSEKAFAELKGSGFSGTLNTGAPGAGATTQTNPWMKGQKNLTLQAKILRDDPDLAKSLKAAAGVRD